MFVGPGGQSGVAAHTRRFGLRIHRLSAPKGADETGFR
ncbi:hypothetical protein MOTT12_01104 [Mycobacterium intracellulare subsp. yongonense]|nr:hypothetical protein MOTT12_01104 [Mycobacterium intracellulare subsp. yongonense]ARR81910.1 hypothetical protein MOTT27_01089 [Mycobacterium intracellulare subsp. yongonense]